MTVAYEPAAVADPDEVERRYRYYRPRILAWSLVGYAMFYFVRKNLAVIDRAIAEARMALRSDPGNAYLNLHLANTMRRKVELLRRVNDMAAARS